MKPLASTQRYLHAGTIILSCSGLAAIYLNYEGIRCMEELTTIGDDVQSKQLLEDAAAGCFIITNSYVYSLFGVVVGMILMVLWTFKRKQNPPR